jgi:hypothetical protein
MGRNAMTGKKIVTDWLESRHGCFYGRHEVVGEPCLAEAIDAALAAAQQAMRERCVTVIRDNRGKCVSDTSCEALVEEIRALGVT